MKDLRSEIARSIFVLWVACSCASAYAQTAAAKKAEKPPSTASDREDDGDSVEAIEARKLFLEGRALLNQNRPREACESLEKSYKIAHTLGALLNLGLCHSYNGHLATAHEYYRKAEIMATLQNDPRREFAHNEAAALAPRRATLTLRVHDKDAALEVRLDDIPRARESLDYPIYIDGGEHRVAVYEDGKQRWQGTVLVVDGNKHVLEIPMIGAGAKSTVPSPPPDRASEAPPSSYEEMLVERKAVAENTTHTSGLGTTRIVALSVGGAGVAALGASLIYTLAASRSFDDSNRGPCSSSTDICTPKGLALRDDALAHATRATIFGVAGTAALAAGVVLWLIAAPDVEKPPPLAIEAVPQTVSVRWTARF